MKHARLHQGLLHTKPVHLDSSGATGCPDFRPSFSNCPPESRTSRVRLSFRWTWEARLRTVLEPLGRKTGWTWHSPPRNRRCPPLGSGRTISGHLVTVFQIIFNLFVSYIFITIIINLVESSNEIILNVWRWVNGNKH